MKKLLCTLMVTLLVLTSVPLGGFVGMELPKLFKAKAAETSANQYLTSGYCGDTSDGGSAQDIAWSLDDSGVLTITGNGKIAEKAFAYDNRIKEVVISDGIFNISSYCFSDCDNLTKVTMGDDVKSVDDYAFYYCDKLTNIDFSDSLTTIGSDAFYACSKLTSIEFPDSLIKIGTSAFGCCSKLTSIVIPDSVTTIGSSTFYDCDGLVSATLSNSITKINACVFYDCDALTTIEFSNSLKTIGYRAFYSCNSLKAIVLPNSMTTIGESAFHYCQSLESVEFSDSLTTIDSHAFYDCSKLSNIKFPDSLTTIGESAFVSCDGITDLVFPDSLKTIEYRAFYWCHNLASVEFLDSVTTIGEGAFSTCQKLISVTIGSNLKSIDFPSVFRGCSKLSTITISNDNESYASCDGVVYNKGMTELIYVPSAISGEITIPKSVKSFSYTSVDGCFGLTALNVEEGSEYYKSVDGIVYSADGEKLIVCPRKKSGSVVVADGTKSIVEYAFYQCDDLTSIAFPNSLTAIENYAFKYCDGFTSIGFPNSLETIGNDAFYCCLNLTSIAFPDSLKTIGSGAFAGYNKLTSIDLPDSVTTIGEGAFSTCQKLISVTIGSNLKSIDFPSVFKGCSKLSTITISNDNESYASCDGVVYNKGMTELIYVPNAISGEITMPKTVESFTYTSIDTCKGITALNVEEGNENYKSVDGIVYSTDDKKLVVCPRGKVGSVSIADGTKSIGERAFSGCGNITSVKLSDSVITIDAFAFYACTNLANIQFSDSLETIDLQAFWYCSKLTNLVFPNSLKTIGKDVFYCCSNLTSIEFSNSLETIDSCAFYYCSNLTSIEFPDSLKTIGGYAFGRCDSLTSIDFSNSLTTIGSYAFCDCTNLTSINLPKSLTKIDNNMFKECGFTDLTLPDHIQSFNKQGWSKLQTLTIENRYCEYTDTTSPGFKSDCTIRAYCGSPGHELAVKQLYNFESLGHTYLDWYTYKLATYTSEGIERRDCAYCGGYEERPIPKLQNDIFTATFVADGNVVATVDFPKGTTEIDEPQVPAKDRYMGEWESYTLNDSDITINALYTLIKSADASEIETSSETVNYTDYDDVLFKLKAWAKAKTVKSTVSKVVPLDIVLVLDQSGSMADTLGGTVKKVDALKSTAKEFIGTVYENAKLTGADHRISVVGFGLSGNYQGYEKNENTELLTSDRGIVKYDNIKKSDYASSLLSVNTNGNVNEKLISAIDSIDARGATAADLGFEMAKGIFANTNSADRQRVVIFMTDGEPTYSSSFETSVANSAIANASVLKSTYKASIYSVGIFSDYDSRNTKVKTFMNAVSSGYPDAMSMSYLGTGVDGQYYMTVSNTDSLSGVFKSISTESLSHTAPFENVTIIKTLSKYVTLTSKQEKQLRIDLIRAYGITDDDIVITRNADGTTEIKLCSLTPYEVTDDKGNVTYEVSVEFFASLNENAVAKGDYVVDTEDSGVMLGDDALGYEATFDTSTVTLDSNKTRVIFTINGEIYYISEKLSNGYAVAPEMDLADDWQFSGWDTSSKKATNGTVFDATLVKANRTVIWHTAQGDITQSYVEGDYIVLPTIEPYNSNGDTFLSWNKSIPTTMPDENLEFTAVYGGHVHKYSSAVTKEMTCLTDGIRTFTCSCGDTYDETIPATGHNYEAITPSLDKTDAKCTFCCTYCGDKYDYALDYEVVSSTNKKYNVVYEFKLTDEELDTEMQPDGEIKIRIPLSELHVRAERVTVIRTNPDGSKTIVPATIEKGCLVITCDHFTPYEVVFDVPCEKHNQGDWIITKKATCTEKGSKYANCTECEKKIAEEEIDKLDHKYSSVTTTPTCTDKGYTTNTCSICGDTYTANETSALGHSLSTYITTKSPTCTEKGKSTATCSRCDYVETKDISATGHNFQDGKCTNCGETKSCSCNCHKSGFMGFIWKIQRFFYKIFKTHKTCDCGVAHY